MLLRRAPRQRQFFFTPCVHVSSSGWPYWWCWCRLLFAMPLPRAAAGAGPKRHAPIRIDYCLASAPPLSAQHTLVDTGRGFSFSDHLGLAVVLDLASSTNTGGSGGSRPTSAVARRRRAVLSRSVDCLATAIRALQQRRSTSALNGLLLLVAFVALLASCVCYAGNPSALQLLVTAAGTGACSFCAAALLLLTLVRTIELSALQQAHAHATLALGSAV